MSNYYFYSARFVGHYFLVDHFNKADNPFLEINML